MTQGRTWHSLLLAIYLPHREILLGGSIAALDHDEACTVVSRVVIAFPRPAGWVPGATLHTPGCTYTYMLQ